MRSHEAAYTEPPQPDVHYPAYANARVEGDAVVLRVRSRSASTAAEITLPRDAFQQWLAELQRVAQELG